MQPDVIDGTLTAGGHQYSSAKRKVTTSTPYCFLYQPSLLQGLNEGLIETMDVEDAVLPSSTPLCKIFKLTFRRESRRVEFSRFRYESNPPT